MSNESVELMHDAYERLKSRGLSSYSKADFKGAQAYLLMLDLDVRVRKVTLKGYRPNYIVSYNGRNYNGSKITKFDKMANHFQRNHAEIEVLYIAMKYFERAELIKSQK